MKRVFFIFFVICSQSINSIAQVHKKSEISFSFGPSFAIGKFSNTNFFKNSSDYAKLGEFKNSPGFVKNGESVTLSYLKPFSTNWKFVIQLSGQRNPISTSALETNFSIAKIYQGFIFGQPYDDLPFMPSKNQFYPKNSTFYPTYYSIYPEWHFDKKSWLLGSLQIGVLRQFISSTQNKLTPTIKVTIGTIYAISPHITGRSMSNTETALIDQGKTSGIGLISTIGGGLNYSLTKKVILCTTLDYGLTSNINFKGIKSTSTRTKGSLALSNYSIEQTGFTTYRKQTISSINLLFGISFVL